MKRHVIGALVVTCLALAGAVPAAQAQMQGFKRFGPTGLGGYPSWYQDKTGLAMEFCSPLTQSELDGGWCLLLAGDTTAPEVFPGSFFGEHFYWAANANANPTKALINGVQVKALLVMALEGAFAVGPVIDGDQITFGRMRIVINPLPYSGTYTVYTPFGKRVFPNLVAGDKLFFTEDIGIQCAPGNFACALDSKIGPFLLPSAVPGGVEMPALTADNPTPDTDPAHFGGAFAPTAYPNTGKKYIADPARIGPVTGSREAPFASPFQADPLNPNRFRIEGPNGLLLDTTDFSLMGRVFEGAIPGRVTIDRVSYARTATDNKLSVYATGLPSTQARIPAAAAPAEITPTLQYYEAPCVPNFDPVTGDFVNYTVPQGVTPVQIRGEGTNYWGQSAPAAVPKAGVCVVQTNAVDAAGNQFTAFFPANVADQVTMFDATYDPANQTLTVQAGSSDEATPPLLSAVNYGALNAGLLVIPNVLAPPSAVLVRSESFGEASLLVKTGAGGTGAGQPLPTAVNDTFTILEDSGQSSFAVTANDMIGSVVGLPAGSIVQLTSLPKKGQAVVSSGSILYTPGANLNGADSFSYTVAVNGMVSNQASVTVNITPVNDPPVAVNDSFNVPANATVILGVLANDFDVDGAADIVGVGNVSALSPATGAKLTVTAASEVQFTGTTPGTYTFTYRSKDASGALSANTATVTVVVAASEVINVTLAEYRSSGARLRFSGTVTPARSVRLTIKWYDGTNTVGIVATPTSDATGAWAVDVKGVAGTIQDPNASGATQYIVTTPSGAVRTGTITKR